MGGLKRFVNAQTLPTQRRLILSVEGKEKEGKTHFALTAPAPIALFDMDRGLEGVVEKFAGEKRILVAGYRNMPHKTPDDWVALWDWFTRDYNEACESGEIRTIIVDTATEAWENVRLAILGKLTQVPPVKYAEVNKVFRGLIDQASDAGKNLILIHKLKKEYSKNSEGKDAWTGEYERAGFGEAGYIVQANLRLYRQWNRREKTWGDFVCRVRDCRQNSEIAGEEFDGALCNFQYVASQILPNVPPDAWV